MIQRKEFAMSTKRNFKHLVTVSIVLSLILWLCYIPQISAQDTTETYPFTTIDTVKVLDYTSIITIGKYEIKQDSLINMTIEELNNFIILVRLFSIPNLYLKDEIIDRFCIKYLPKRILKNKK